MRPLSANVPEEEFLLDISSASNSLRRTVVRVPPACGATRVEFVHP